MFCSNRFKDNNNHTSRCGANGYVFKNVRWAYKKGRRQPYNWYSPMLRNRQRHCTLFGSSRQRQAICIKIYVIYAERRRTQTRNRTTKRLFPTTTRIVEKAPRNTRVGADRCVCPIQEPGENRTHSTKATPPPTDAWPCLWELEKRIIKRRQQWYTQ